MEKQKLIRCIVYGPTEFVTEEETKQIQSFAKKLSGGTAIGDYIEWILVGVHGKMLGDSLLIQERKEKKKEKEDEEEEEQEPCRAAFLTGKSVKDMAKFFTDSDAALCFANSCCELSDYGKTIHQQVQLVKDIKLYTLPTDYMIRSLFDLSETKSNLFD